MSYWIRILCLISTSAVIHARENQCFIGREEKQQWILEGLADENRCDSVIIAGTNKKRDLPEFMSGGHYPGDLLSGTYTTANFTRLCTHPNQGVPSADTTSAGTTYAGTRTAATTSTGPRHAETTTVETLAAAETTIAETTSTGTTETTTEASTAADIDGCATGAANCDANAQCSNAAGSLTCTCILGYNGDGTTCTDVDECATGADNCDTNANCLNTDGSFTCTCNPGYSGDGTTCTDIDECTTSADNCDTNAQCSNNAGGFTCTCNTGYDGGGITCTDIDECVVNTDNCDTNALCSNTAGGFTCTCNSLYDGDGTTCTLACDVPHALGMENGDIAAGQLSASTIYDDGSHWDYSPDSARLNNNDDAYWAPSAANNQWFQVDFQAVIIVTKIQTQGCGCSDGGSGEYIETLRIKYESDANSLEFVRDNTGSNSVKTFDANINANSVADIVLPGLIETRYLQIIPKTWNSYPGLRLEVFGCD